MTNYISITRPLGKYVDLGVLAPIVGVQDIGTTSIRHIHSQSYQMDSRTTNSTVVLTDNIIDKYGRDMVEDVVVGVLDSLYLNECSTIRQLLYAIEDDLKNMGGGKSYYVVYNTNTGDVFNNYPRGLNRLTKIVLPDDLLGDGFVYLVKRKSIKYVRGNNLTMQVEGGLTTVTIEHGVELKEGLQRAYYCDL